MAVLLGALLVLPPESLLRQHFKHPDTFPYVRFNILFMEYRSQHLRLGVEK